MWVISMRRPHGIYYAVVESYRDESGAPRRRTIAGLGKHPTCFAKAEDLFARAARERKASNHDSPEEGAAREERAAALEQEARRLQELGREVLRDRQRRRFLG